MPASPSLLIVPARFKTGKLYTQIATTSGGVVLGSSGDFNVTRATTATRFNSAGLIESVASGVPRLDYFTSGGTAGCPALLVEASGSNLALRSEEFNVSGTWIPTNASVSGNTTIAPDGTTTADTLTATSNGGQIQQVYVGVSGTTYTVSFYIKRRTGTGTVNIRAVENVNTPVTVTSNWTRVSFSATATSTSVRVGVSLATSGDEVDLWGAQLETGSIATSYIPTTTAPITRNADVITLSGAVSGCIGQTEGTIYTEFEYKTNAAERRLIALSNGTSSDRVMVWTLNNTLYAQVEGGSIILANPITEGYHKLAFAYQQNGVSGTLFASLDGGAVVSGTSAAFPASLTDINIGKNEATATSTFFWNARIRAAAIYTSRLTNAELAALTTL